MQTWWGVAGLPADLGPTSVTIGVFDGVHRGHRLLLDRVVADRWHGLLPVVVTFDPHPMVVLRPEAAPLSLSSLPHRLELLAMAGIQGVLVLPFDRELASLSAERFASAVICRGLHARHVVVGENFRFGNRAAGDVTLLRELGRELGFEVTSIGLAPLAGSEDDKAGAPMSSTAIRALIRQGDVAAAALALGRRHRVSGPVVAGQRRGRQLGFPTANLAVPAGTAIPGDGVYAAQVRVGPAGQWLPAAVSVGTNPTFEDVPRRVEAYVIDAPADFDVYGRQVDVEFVAFVRPMVRFDSVAQLVAQMAEDVEQVREILAGTSAGAGL